MLESKGRCFLQGNNEHAGGLDEDVQPYCHDYKSCHNHDYGYEPRSAAEVVAGDEGMSENLFYSRGSDDMGTRYHDIYRSLVQKYRRFRILGRQVVNEENDVL